MIADEGSTETKCVLYDEKFINHVDIKCSE